jgi:putative phage-type endonuclease
MSEPIDAEFVLPVRLIGGSDAGPACGVEVYGRNRITLWEELTGRRPRPDLTSRPIRRGNSLEDWIGAEYAIETGQDVRRRRKAFVSAKYPWMRAHIDRRVTNTRVILECKSVHPLAMRSGQWGDAGSDEVPLHYLLQCVHYNVVTNAERTDLAAMFGDELRIYRIARNAELEARLIEREREVWDCAARDEPPMPITAAEVRALYPGDDGSQIVATPELVAVCERLTALKSELDTLGTEKDQLTERLQLFIAECAALIDERGNTLATWKQAKASIETDWKAAFVRLVKIIDAPETGAQVLDMCTTTIPGSRRFLLKKGAA